MDEFNYVLILLKMSNKHRKKDDSQKKKIQAAIHTGCLRSISIYYFLSLVFCSRMMVSEIIDN
jgi:hypothetical protein